MLLRATKLQGTLVCFSFPWNDDFGITEWGWKVPSVGSQMILTALSFNFLFCFKAALGSGGLKAVCDSWIEASYLSCLLWAKLTRNVWSFLISLTAGITSEALHLQEHLWLLSLQLSVKIFRQRSLHKDGVVLLLLLSQVICHAWACFCTFNV